MNREFLANFGLEKEQITQILNQHSEDIGNALKKPTNNEEKIKLDIEDLQEKLNQANETIKTLKKATKDNEQLQAKIQEYQQNIEALNIQHTKDQISHYTTMKLKDNGAINTKAILPFVDLEKGSINPDGSITGIDEQIDQILGDEELKFLFRRNEPTIPTQQVEKPIRGGYEPIEGTAVESKGIGELMAEKVIKERSQATDTSSFWDSLSS